MADSTMPAAPAVIGAAELRAGRRQAIGAAIIGNILEWYDFSIYAFVATIIAKRFFPPGDEIAALLSTFAAFGIGFLARPLGGIVIGRLADRRGRKVALILTLFMMAAGTVAIGLIPGYETLGWAAPALLVLARLAQGFRPAGSGAVRPRLSSSGRPTTGAASTAAFIRRASRWGCCWARVSRRCSAPC